MADTFRIVDLPPSGGLDGSEVLEATKNGQSVRVLTSQLFTAGKSAYQVAVLAGFSGDETQWLASLKGDTGEAGANGLSAYEVALSEGYSGTQAQWLESQRGLRGLTGDEGEQGPPGPSAFEVATANGFVGTQAQWLASLKGEDAIDLTALQALAAPTSEEEVVVLSGGEVKRAALTKLLDSGLAGALVYQRAGKTLLIFPDDVTGSTVLNGELVILPSDSPLLVQRATNVVGALSVTGDASVTGGLQVSGDHEVGGALTVQSSASINNASLGGATEVTGELNVDAGGTLDFAGTIALSGEIALSGTVAGDGLSVTGVDYAQIEVIEGVTSLIDGGGRDLVAAVTAAARQTIPLACSDEVTALTTGTKVTFRAPYAFKLNDVKASLTTAQTGGAVLTVNVKVNGTSIFSTLLTFNNGSKTTKGATTPYAFVAGFVTGNQLLADDDEVTVEIAQIGDGTAKGLKVYLNGQYI